MGRYILTCACAVVILHFAEITSAEVLAPMTAFLEANRTAFLAGGMIGVIVLVCASLLFGGIGFFNVLYLLARSVNELVQLLICAMGMAALIFWFDLGVNFWLEGGGTPTIVLFAWLYGSAFCLRIFDFNYPIKDDLIAYSAFPFVCMAVVWVSKLVL